MFWVVYAMTRKMYDSVIWVVYFVCLATDLLEENGRNLDCFVFKKKWKMGGLALSTLLQFTEIKMVICVKLWC